MGAEAKLPGRHEFAKILRDPDEIAVEMGEATIVDGVVVHKRQDRYAPVTADTDSKLRTRV